MRFSICSLCTEPLGDRQLRTVSSFYQLVQLMNISTTGHQVHETREHPLDESHKNQGTKLKNLGTRHEYRLLFGRY